MSRHFEILFVVITSHIATAQSLPPVDPALTVLVRDLLIEHMPKPLVETHENWDKQRVVTVGVKLHRYWLETQRDLCNDGHWHRLKIGPATQKTR